MKFLLCFGIVLAFVTERALTQQYLLGKLPIQSDGRNFGGIFDQNSVLTRLSSLEASVAPLTSGFPALQNQVAVLPNQVATLQGQVSSLQSLPNQIATFQSQVSSLQNLTNIISTIQSQVTTLQSLTNQVATLNSSLAASNAKLVADEATIAAAQASITALQTQLAAAQNATTAAQNTATSAQTAAAGAQTTATAAQTAAAGAQTTATSAQTAAAAAQTTATAAQAAATATPTPKCNSAATALGAQLVDGLCVSVEGGAAASPNLNYNSAMLDCLAKNGKLAEPPVTLSAFYNDLNSNTVLKPKITALGTNGMYVGIAVDSSLTPIAYAYKTSGAIVAAPLTPTNIWATNPTIPGVAGKVTYIVTPFATTTTWLTGDADGAVARGYICQYPVV